MRQLGHDVDHVARNFDVDRPLVAGRGVQHAVDLAKGHRRIVQLGAGDAQLFEHFELRAKIAHPVVQQRIVDAARSSPGEPVITTTGDFSA